MELSPKRLQSVHCLQIEGQFAVMTHDRSLAKMSNMVNSISAADATRFAFWMLLEDVSITESCE